MFGLICNLPKSKTDMSLKGLPSPRAEFSMIEILSYSLKLLNYIAFNLPLLVPNTVI